MTLGELTSPIRAGSAYAVSSLPGSPGAVASDPTEPVVRFCAPLTLTVRAGPNDMVAADLNADAKPDLGIVNFNAHRVSILLGTGTGSFQKPIEYKTSRYPAAISAGDIDGDGDPDVVTASADKHGSISLFVNRGRARLRRAATYRTGSESYGVAIGDIDSDGRADVVAANRGRKPLSVFLGRRRGRLRLAHRYGGTSANGVEVGDFDADGNLDVAVAINGRHVAVRPGRGDGTFGPARRYKSGREPWDVTVADLNQDAKLDIVVGDYAGGSVWVHLAVRDGTFAAGRRFRMGDGQVERGLIADFDRDGTVDIAAPEDGSDDEADFSGVLVRRGLGDGTFDKPISHYDFPFDLPTVGGAVADFDGDGLPDLAFSEGLDSVGYDYEPPPSKRAFVFLNRSGPSAPPCAVQP